MANNVQNFMRPLGIFSGAIGDPLAMGSGLLFDNLLGGMFDDKPKDYSASASYQAAQLLRDQYEDWRKTFKPVELGALSQVSMTNPGVLPNALRSASDMVDDTYKSMGGVMDRQMESFGVKPTDQQAATSRRLMDLSKASSKVATQNNTRMATRRLDEMLISGASPNPNVGG